ncbi:MAG: DNA mismatch repair endonuclease MutL [Muribaculaceae bacterium]|nr:DNA mismatch repair endonuclease MutL [Muribaculaceae bacterium]
MSDVIKLLPDSVANQIAAGEVIQRPASVIKELVENSIDAGATSIQIVLKDAGRTLIQVIDNGAGMSETDARLSFERHSTSKIRKVADLFSLHTMGFRGEALASIAAISHVELRTQRKEDSIGTMLVVEASKCLSQEPVAYGVGSNFMIKNIFFNVPARRKFLKNNQVELSNIVREFERLALVNHNTEFKLIHNGATMFELLPGNFKQRVVSLFGRAFETQLIPVSLDTTLIRIEGFVCKPENARKRNQQQFMFVNGRYMRHPYFHKAITSSYDQLIQTIEQPNYFLNFTVDPDTIDINIHPTKTEIKFENEQSIWQIIMAAVKETLGKFSVAPSIDFDTEGAPEIPVFNKERVTITPTIDLDPSYNPFSSVSSSKTTESKLNNYNPQEPKKVVNQDWQKLYNSFLDTKEESFEEAQQSTIVESKMSKCSTVETIPSLSISLEETQTSVLLQIRGRYILSQIKSGLMMIDQHRAHIRILFDRFIAQQSVGSIVSQRVLFPDVLHLSVSQNLILEEMLSQIQSVGFDLSFLGDNSWAINGVPAGVENIDVKDTLLEVIDSIKNGGESIESKIYEHIALVVSKKAAIPYGKSLTQEEMDTLQSDLLQLPKPNYTPDGKLIINIMTIDNINKIFQ